MKKLENLRVYALAEEIADRIWSICDKWPIFAKHTVGEQFVRAFVELNKKLEELAPQLNAYRLLATNE